MATLRFYTWHYTVGFNNHSVTMVATSRDDAVTRLLQSVAKKRVLNLEGPYTMNLEWVVANGIQESFDQPAVSFEEFIRQKEPQVTDLDAVISVSALDG
jgi:tRNA A37 threonylcarbamoyltransferase TsaD